MQGRNFFLLGLCCSIGCIPPQWSYKTTPETSRGLKVLRSAPQDSMAASFPFILLSLKAPRLLRQCVNKGYSTREVSGIQRCSFLLCGGEKAGDKYREKTKILGLPPWGQKQSDVNSSNFSTNFTQLDFALHTAPGEKWLWQNPSCRYIPASAQITDRQLEPGELYRFRVDSHWFILLY